MTSPGFIQGPKRAPGAGSLPSNYAAENQSKAIPQQNPPSTSRELVAKINSTLGKAIEAGENARIAGETARTANAAVKEGEEKLQALGVAKKEAQSQATFHAERAQNARQNAQVARRQVEELEGDLNQIQTQKAVLAEREREVEAKSREIAAERRQLQMKLAAAKAYQAKQQAALKQIKT